MIRFILAALLIASPALADVPCMPLADLIAKLDDSYSERNMARGIEARGGTWTLVVIPPTEGPLLACPVAAGTGWKMIAPDIDG